MDPKQIKKESHQALFHYWEERLGQDFDDKYHSMPEWVEIRKIDQAIMEYDHDSSTCTHDFEKVMWGEEKGWYVCHKCGMRNYEMEIEEGF